MALKRQFSFKWRLFVPLSLLMWIVIGTFAYYTYRHETRYRERTIDLQLNRIGSKVLQAYDNDMDLTPFMNFVRYYNAQSLYSDLRVSVYDRNGDLIYSIGKPTVSDFTNVADLEELITTDTGVKSKDNILFGEKYFYASAVKSNDGQVFVHTVLPNSEKVRDRLSLGPEFWILVATVFVVATVLVYILSGYLTRNVKLLRVFADKAASNIDTGDDELFDESIFPHDELGDISRRIVELYHDRIDALRRAGTEHKIAINAVEEKSRLKRQLTNNINHELKTPVGVVRGYLETVLSSPDMDDTMRTHFLQRAQDNVNRLCALLGDVSTMTRLEEGAGNIPTEEIDFHDLVFAVANDLETGGVLRDMKFTFDIPLNCSVRGNAGLLTGVITNLAKNAAIHSHGTKMCLNITAESERYYTFHFYDNGNGVDEEHLAHLFVRFYRIDSGRARKTGGTGLGLPIVKNTIEALGGTISVNNRLGGGLGFMFTLEKWGTNVKKG